MHADLQGPAAAQEGVAQAAQAARAAQQARIDAEVARVRAEMARAQAEQARAAGELAAAQAEGRLGDTRVVRGPDGRMTVSLPDGRAITIEGGPGVSPEALLHDAGVHVPPDMPPRDASAPFLRFGLAGALFCLVLALVWYVARASGRRAALPVARAAPPDLDARLQRIEQAVETIAIEVERVSEAQRFSARLLAERGPSPAASPASPGRHTPVAGTPHS